VEKVVVITSEGGCVHIMTWDQDMQANWQHLIKCHELNFEGIGAAWSG
jgi:hypothetical protein